MNPFEIEKLLPWGPPKRVSTSQGERNLRTAPAPQTMEWRAVWKANKEALKSAGLSWPPGRDWTFKEICWWQPIDKREMEAKAEAIEASRATDADIEIPAPDGLEYLGYQKAGIRFALKIFGDSLNGEQKGGSPSRGVLIADEMGL